MKLGTPVEVCVVSGGVNDKNWGKSMDIEEDQYMMSAIDYTVTW